MELMGKREFYLLMYLKESGYLYIARDESSTIFAYEKQPEKYERTWIPCGNRMFYIDAELFSFITWQDEEPTLIQDLMKEVK